MLNDEDVDQITVGGIEPPPRDSQVISTDKSNVKGFWTYYKIRVHNWLPKIWNNQTPDIGTVKRCGCSKFNMTQ